MHVIRYIFDSINCTNTSDYIFQYIEHRKLSDIYHSHDFYEGIAVLNGNCIQRVNDKEIFTEAGTCILLCPDDCHCFLQQSEDIKLLCLSVRAEEFLRLAAVFHLSTSELEPSGVPLSSGDFHCFVDYSDSHSENDYKILLAHFIKVLADRPNKKHSVPSALRFAVKEMNMQQNLRIGLDKFSELSGYSKSQLNRLMQKHYNTTSHEYLLNLRLEIAYKELIYTTKNMEEIAEGLGYASFSHFNKIFKEKYSITPAALRKNHGFRTI